MRSPSSLLNQAITFEELGAPVIDAYGNESQAHVTFATLPARVEARSGRMDFGGRWVEFRGWRAYLDGDPGVTFTMRADYDGRQLEIVWIDPQPDRDGTVNHTVVWMQEAE